MTPDRERWAEALSIEHLHGADAPRWIVEQIGALALAGDEEGIARFREIAGGYEQMMTQAAVQ